MKLEDLKGFDWYNEPENVIFNGGFMTIIPKSETDFWQSKGHDFAKDNGHFFYKTTSSGFTMVAHWSFADAGNFKQCGVMLRKDCENWFKVSLMCQNAANPEIGHCLSAGGNADWAVVPLLKAPTALWYKIVRQGNDCLCFYSADGVRFVKLRQFYLEGRNIQAGVYICNPGKDNFQAVLENISFI